MFRAPVAGTRANRKLQHRHILRFNSLARENVWRLFRRKPSLTHPPTHPRRALRLMRCAKGIGAKGFLGMYEVFPFAVGKRVWDFLLRWGKGEKGLRLPRSLGPRSEHEERGSLRPFSPSQEGVSDPFPHRKRGNPAHPRIPSTKIPLAQRITPQGYERRELLQESSGPSGPKSPPKCPRECPRKAGCAWECLRECSRDPLSPAQNVSKKWCLKKILFGHSSVTFIRAPRALPQTLSGTPRFLGDTLSDTPRGTSGPKGPKTPVGGRRVLKSQGYKQPHRGEK